MVFWLDWHRGFSGMGSPPTGTGPGGSTNRHHDVRPRGSIQRGRVLDGPPAARRFAGGTGNNPFTGVTETRTFQGAFDLAPTWCRGTGTVLLEEMQAVSACLFARMNTKGIHNPLSLRGVNSSLALGDNEKLFMAYPEGQFFGNIWDASDKIFDPTTSRYYKTCALIRAFSRRAPTVHP